MNLNSRVGELKRKFREASEYVGKGDAVQAVEKLYKVAENAMKILSEINGMPEYEVARREGSWWTKLLDRVKSCVVWLCVMVSGLVTNGFIRVGCL